MTTRRAAHPRVVLRDGDEASGMATMLADLLRDNVADFPARSRIAALTRGSLVLTASDRDMSITISFCPGKIQVADGAKPGAPGMAGPWLAMSRVCSGRISPLRALVDRELALGRGRRIWVLAAGGYVLSVPASFYGDTEVIRKRRMIALACIVVVMVAGLATPLIRISDRRWQTRTRCGPDREDHRRLSRAGSSRGPLRSPGRSRRC